MKVSFGRLGVVLLVVTTGLVVISYAQPPGESPRLGTSRVTHEQIVSGEMNRDQIRQAGLEVFSTPFNKLDGYGDGPMDLNDTVSPGGRPTLGGNGTLLRVNGLDGQTCLECHSLLSAAEMPPRLGIGGVGGSVTNAMIMPTAMDPADLEDLDNSAGFNGRFANPPFLFGAGGVELLANEMTQELQQQKQWAIDNPGLVVPLTAKGISFGSIVADGSGDVNTSQLEGVDPDLVVKPFGRKGEFATTRDFDIGAMQFHFGMQPVEVVGEDVDADGDGVVNEILVGELSALQVFATTLSTPVQDSATAVTAAGFGSFQDVGCANCHVPEMHTNSVDLGLRFPIVHSDPSANVYYEVDLTKTPMKFTSNGAGGLVVPLYADLKRHDMGPGLAESFGLVDEQTNRMFTTGRLWGIADTAPYLHDGRATTLTEAILSHGGEAQEARDNFDALSDVEKAAVLAFLRTLRTPEDPFKPKARPGQGRHDATDREGLEELSRFR